MADSSMLKRLDEVEKKYSEIESQLSNPDISPSEIHKFSKERSELDNVVKTYREYKKTLEEIENNKTLLHDEELSELVKDELDSLGNKKSGLEKKLKVLHLTTLALVRNRGRLSEEELTAFSEAGYGNRQLLEIILGVAQKVMSNYVNHLAQTPVDEPFQKFAWPAKRL